MSGKKKRNKKSKRIEKLLIQLAPAIISLIGNIIAALIASSNK